MSMNYLDYLDYLEKTHWIVLYVNDNNVTYFDSFEVEHIPKEIKKFIEKKNHNKYLQNTGIRFNNV